jgi:hypothetical protein
VVSIGLLASNLSTVPVTAADPLVSIKLPATVQIDTHALPGPNDPDRCLAHAFARVPHIRLAVGYQVHVDDTSVHDLDMAFSGPPFPDDDHVWGVPWPVPAGHHQFALSAFSTGKGCAQAILAVEGRWVIWKARVSMNRRFTDRYREPFDECRRRVAKPRVLADPIVVGAPGQPIGVQRVGKQGSVKVTEEEAILDWENQVQLEWWGDGEAPLLVKTGADAIARVVDGNGRGIIIGPGMTVRITPGKPYQVIKQGRGSFDTLSGVRPITDDVATRGCTIASQ